jgi:hypothetical protein
MHINEARLTATEVLRTPTLIAVANREQKLSDTMAAELAALDRAAADVVSGQPGMRGIFPTDPEWALLDALEAAAGGYRAMREMRNGLACDANAGGMTGAVFAQALCRIARVDVCSSCELFVGPNQGHFCAQTRGDGGRALGMSATFDPLSRTVVIGQDDRGDVTLSLAEFLRRCNITLDDMQRALGAPGAPSTAKANWKIRRRGTVLFSNGGTEPEFTKTGKTWATRGYVMAHLRGYAETEAHKQRQLRPIDDAALLRFIPDDWEVVAYPIDAVPSVVLTPADFLASRASR